MPTAKPANPDQAGGGWLASRDPDRQQEDGEHARQRGHGVGDAEAEPGAGVAARTDGVATADA
jgi:hypothetical protein